MEKEARAGRRNTWEGQAAPTATHRLPITIKHFNDFLSDESLDFIIIHHVSLRKEKKNLPQLYFQTWCSFPGNRVYGTKGRGEKQRSQELPTDT